VAQRIALAVGILLIALAVADAIADRHPSGVDLGARDTSVRPGGRFFFGYALVIGIRSANSRLTKTETGADTEVSARVREQLRLIIEDGANHPDDSEKALIGGLYSSFMDETRIELLDAAPLRADLDRIAQVPTKKISYL